MQARLDRIIETLQTSHAITVEDACEHCNIIGDAENSSVEKYIAVAEAYLKNRYNVEFGVTKREAEFYISERSIERLYFSQAQVLEVESITSGYGENLTGNLHKGSYVSFLDFGGSYLPYKATIRVQYTCGFDGNIPEEIKQSARLLVAHYFDNRNAESEFKSEKIGYAVEALMQNYNRLKIV